MKRIQGASSEIGAASLRPMRERVLIRVDDRVEQIGSIHVPHVARALPNTGVIVRVGEGCGLEVGARVVIERYAHGDREYVILDGARHLVVRRDQVIAVLS